MHKTEPAPNLVHPDRSGAQSSDREGTSLRCRDLQGASMVLQVLKGTNNARLDIDSHDSNTESENRINRILHTYASRAVSTGFLKVKTNDDQSWQIRSM